MTDEEKARFRKQLMWTAMDECHTYDSSKCVDWFLDRIIELHEQLSEVKKNG